MNLEVLKFQEYEGKDSSREVITIKDLNRGTVSCFYRSKGTSTNYMMEGTWYPFDCKIFQGNISKLTMENVFSNMIKYFCNSSSRCRAFIDPYYEHYLDFFQKIFEEVEPQWNEFIAALETVGVVPDKYIPSLYQSGNGAQNILLYFHDLYSMKISHKLGGGIWDNDPSSDVYKIHRDSYPPTYHFFNVFVRYLIHAIVRNIMDDESGTVGKPKFFEEGRVPVRAEKTFGSVIRDIEPESDHGGRRPELEKNASHIIPPRKDRAEGQLDEITPTKRFYPGYLNRELELEQAERLHSTTPKQMLLPLNRRRRVVE